MSSMGTVASSQLSWPPPGQGEGIWTKEVEVKIRCSLKVCKKDQRRDQPQDKTLEQHLMWVFRQMVCSRGKNCVWTICLWQPTFCLNNFVQIFLSQSFQRVLDWPSNWVAEYQWGINYTTVDHLYKQTSLSGKVGKNKKILLSSITIISSSFNVELNASCQACIEKQHFWSVCIVQKDRTLIRIGTLNYLPSKLSNHFPNCGQRG